MTNLTILSESKAVVDLEYINTGLIIGATIGGTVKSQDETPFEMPIFAFLVRRGDDVYLFDIGLMEKPLNYRREIVDFWNGTGPIPLDTLPKTLSKSDLASLKGVFLSHGHWDHVGDAHTVPEGVPLYVGHGTRAGIETGTLGFHAATSRPDLVSKLSELAFSPISIGGFERGIDFFGDRSFWLVEAPGHCAGHMIALARVSAEPDHFIVLGADSGHHRWLYAPCPCHSTPNPLPDNQQAHLDREQAEETLRKLSGLHALDNVWVVLAHEYQLRGIVPERTSLQKWKQAGWKEAVGAVNGVNRH